MSWHYPYYPSAPALRWTLKLENNSASLVVPAAPSQVRLIPDARWNVLGAPSGPVGDTVWRRRQWFEFSSPVANLQFVSWEGQTWNAPSDIKVICFAEAPSWDDTRLRYASSIRPFEVMAEAPSTPSGANNLGYVRRTSGGAVTINGRTWVEVPDAGIFPPTSY